MTPLPHENAAALLRRQQSATARARAGLPALLVELENLEEPELNSPGAPLRTVATSPDRQARDHQTRGHQAPDRQLPAADRDTGAENGER